MFKTRLLLAMLFGPVLMPFVVVSWLLRAGASSRTAEYRSTFVEQKFTPWDRFVLMATAITLVFVVCTVVAIAH